MAAKPIPDGYAAVTPYLIVAGAAAAVDFYGKAFGAAERMRLAGPDGKIGHAELTIGDSLIMLADENPGFGALGPKTIGGSPIHLHIYVADVDAAFARAVAAGATVKQPVADQFYGDRSGSVTDPYGHLWHLATHIEDVAPDEINRRFAAMMAQHKS